MARQSIKRRLIQALHAELIVADNPGAVSRISGYLWELERRGSGPLPHWLVQVAKERGIE